MTHFREGSDAMVELETMVDQAGLESVVEALASICREKADHLRTNWQDKLTAKACEHDAKLLDKLAPRLEF
jgi:hypothetical protein